jgi:hypothetical protein
MATSIEELKAAASKSEGFAMSNMFEIVLPSKFGMSSRDINVICKSTELPGRQMMTQDQQVGTVLRKVVNGFATVDLNLTFYVMNDHKITSYFDEWMKACYDQESNQIQYYKDYVQDIDIKQLQKGYAFSLFKKQLGFLDSIPSSIRARIFDGNPDFQQGEIDFGFGKDAAVIRHIKLLEAFPVTVNAIQLGGDQTDQITEFTVQLSYRDWRSKEADGPTSGFGGSILSGILDRVF